MQRAGERAQRRAHVDHRVIRRQRREFVARRDERLAGLLASLRATVSPKRGSALSPVPTAVPPIASGLNPSQRASIARDRLIELRHPARNHLAEGQRRRILQMRAADHDDIGEGLRLRVERVTQLRTAGSSTFCICSTVAMCMTVGNVSLEDWL